MAVYVGALGLAAFALACALVASGERLDRIWPTAALAVLSAIAERGRVRLSSNLELSISLLPTLFAAVVLGPLAAMVVAAASMIGDFRGTRMKWAIYTLSESITGALTGVVAGVAATAVDGKLASIAVATLAGAVTSQALDTGFSVITVRLRRTGTASDLLRAALPVAVAAVPLYAPVVALLAFTYTEVSPWTLPLFLVPALAAHRLFAMYQDQRTLTGELSAANERLERANLSFATALVATLDARDRYTAGHSAAVAVYARDIAERMALPRAHQELAHLAGLVHDIGKVGLPPGLLEKTGPLTLEERRQMEAHAEIGARILARVDDYAVVASIVRHHHERIDGRGYPDRLRGEAIPLISRIIAVADAYNAMTSGRPYRDAMPTRVARLRLAQAVETQFDTSVVAAFEAILAGATEDYRTGTRKDFAFVVQDDARPRAVGDAAATGS